MDELFNKTIKVIVENYKIPELEAEITKNKMLLSKMMEFIQTTYYRNYNCKICSQSLIFSNIECRGCRKHICVECKPKYINKCSCGTVMHIECEAKKDKICLQCRFEFVTIDDCERYGMGLHRKMDDKYYDIYPCNHCSECCDCY